MYPLYAIQLRFFLLVKSYSYWQIRAFIDIRETISDVKRVFWGCKLGIDATEALDTVGVEYLGKIVFVSIKSIISN